MSETTSRTWSPAVKRAGVVCLLLILAALTLVALQNPGLVTFWPFTAMEFVQTITPLLVVALFIERANEVFVSAWRDAEGDRLQTLVDGSGPSEARTDLLAFRAGTRRLAFLLGVTMGIVVSAVGVRALGQFVDPAVFDQLGATQQRIFNTADVALTGALLGGGADGLHHVVQVAVNFMQGTAERLRTGS